jgi:L-fuculose-phosphate aldolase
MDITEMQTSSMVMMLMDGTPKSDGKPSSEWRFHRDIYQAKPHVGAVVHTHSMFATTLACLQKDIPPFHYMIAIAGGDSIPCAPYALFGTQALSDGAIAALKDRKACLLANHGMIAIGRDLKQALAITQEVETLCEQYWRALQIGEPYLLSKQEMDEVFEQFKGYGNWNQS